MQRYGQVANNEVLIALDIQETSEQDLSKGKDEIKQALEGSAAGANSGKQDLNNSSSLTIANYLLEKDPLHVSADANARYTAVAQAIVNQRDKVESGVLGSIDDLKGVVDPAVVSSLKDGFFLSDFGIRNVEIVGPQVGQQLRKQALLATLYSLAGMLVYLALRFEWIYGVAAVLTVFHDTLITVGAFSLLNWEISLTVIAAILTLIGYSNNDTIVVFDRIRENIKLLRRDKLSDIVNKSINQTLSRTILTAGLTFLTVLALFLFGGEVLARIQLRTRNRNFDWDVFIDCDCGTHPGGVSRMANQAGTEADFNAGAYGPVEGKSQGLRRLENKIFRWNGRFIRFQFDRK